MTSGRKSNKGQRSQWFPMSRRPDLDGVYERRCTGLLKGKAVWTEKNTSLYWWANSCPYCQWRGLAKEPK